MESEISGLEGYGEVRLRGAGGKDFLYQSDEAGSKYVIFATVPDDYSKKKETAPAGFEMPGGYNYWVASK